MHSLKPRKGLLIVVILLLLASLACLSSGGGGDAGDEGQADFDATQRSLESTQNALDVQQEEPTEAPTEVPPTEAPEEQETESEAPVESAPFTLTNLLYSHPSGIFDTYPPEGWSWEEDDGSTLFSAPDGSGDVYYQVTNTGSQLDGDGFVNFINAREANFFGGFDGYTEIEREIDSAQGVAGVTKDLLFDGTPQRVYTFYDQHGQTVYTLDFWANTDVFDAYANVYEEMVDGTIVYSDTAAAQDPYLWIYDFYGPGDLFTMEVPIGFEYAHSEDFQDATIIVDSFYSPDGHMVIENVAYDDGTAISKSVAGQFALQLLHTFYAEDIRITDDQVQSDGSERLTWFSSDGGYSGISFFESRGTTFLLLSLWWDNAYEDIYAPLADYTVGTYSIP